MASKIVWSQSSCSEIRSEKDLWIRGRKFHLSKAARYRRVANRLRSHCNYKVFIDRHCGQSLHDEIQDDWSLFHCQNGSESVGLTSCSMKSSISELINSNLNIFVFVVLWDIVPFQLHSVQDSARGSKVASASRRLAITLMVKTSPQVQLAFDRLCAMPIEIDSN
jgi:hypothetical protein